MRILSLIKKPDKLIPIKSKRCLYCRILEVALPNSFLFGGFFLSIVNQKSSRDKKEFPQTRNANKWLLSVYIFVLSFSLHVWMRPFSRLQIPSSFVQLLFEKIGHIIWEISLRIKWPKAKKTIRNYSLMRNLLRKELAKGPTRLGFFIIMSSFLVKRKIILTLNFNF